MVPLPGVCNNPWQSTDGDGGCCWFFLSRWKSSLLLGWSLMRSDASQTMTGRDKDRPLFDVWLPWHEASSIQLLSVCASAAVGVLYIPSSAWLLDKAGHHLRSWAWPCWEFHLGFYSHAMEDWGTEATWVLSNQTGSQLFFPPPSIAGRNKINQSGICSSPPTTPSNVYI